MFVITQEAVARQDAAAVKTAGPGGTRHLDQQGSLTPEPLAELRQHGTGNVAQGALSESIASAPVVNRLDFASASGTANLSQLGAGRPSGDPGNREGFHTAPTGVGARFRQNAPQRHGALWMPGPKGTV